MWYLSDLTVPLALFSEKVDRDTKARMFRGEDDESKKLEKPKFPDITEKTELYDLFTCNSPDSRVLHHHRCGQQLAADPHGGVGQE